jgi:C-terminal processing protease CtpA/Prc
MILEPNWFFNQPFDGYMSGLAYARTYPGLMELKVNNTFEGSAAKDAGLLVGDEIIKINNRPVSEFTDDDLYRMFRKKGARLRLEIRRNDKQFEKKIKLRRFI